MSRNYCIMLLMFTVLFSVNNASFAGENPDDLIIPVETITQDASFIPVEVDGRKMEVIAVRDSQGKIRTAFNTCQVCHGSELAYYKQSGNSLVCQNCGNRFSMDQVGVRAGGCNPFPIYENQREINNENVIIPHELFKEAKEIFSGWKTDY